MTRHDPVARELVFEVTLPLRRIARPSSRHFGRMAIAGALRDGFSGATVAAIGPGVDDIDPYGSLASRLELEWPERLERGRGEERDRDEEDERGEDREDEDDREDDERDGDRLGDPPSRDGAWRERLERIVEETRQHRARLRELHALREEVARDGHGRELLESIEELIRLEGYRHAERLAELGVSRER